jgi:DNA polymerase-3 subunit beta
MNLSVPGKDLTAALRSINGVVEKRNTVPILANIALESKRQSLVLRATDMDIQMSVSINADVKADGAITVQSQTFSTFISKLAKDVVINLSSDGNILKVAAGRSRCSLNTLPISHYPLLDIGDSTHRFALTRELASSLFGAVQFAISTEETRYYLNGVFMHQVDGRLRCVATDGHRLSKAESAMPNGAAGLRPIIIPRKTVNHLIKMAESGEAIEISASPSKIGARVDNLSLVSKLIDAEYPDYQRVIPKNNDKILKMDRLELQQAADRVSTVSSEKGRAVKITLTSGRIALSVTNPDTGTAMEEIDVEYGSEPLEIGFNSRYLAEILSNMKSELVEVHLADPGSPTLFQSPGDTGLLSVLMPMRV